MFPVIGNLDAAGGVTERPCDDDNSGGGGGKRKKQVREFDMSRFSQRNITLEIFYAGWGYHGFASQGCALIKFSSLRLSSAAA